LALSGNERKAFDSAEFVACFTPLIIIRHIRLFPLLPVAVERKKNCPPGRGQYNS